MATARSKKPQPPKAKEGRKITLGLKQALVTGLGFLMVLIWVFILGVLVGRGDLYRWLHNLGFLRAELMNPKQLPPSVINGAMVPAGQSEQPDAFSASKPAPMATSVSNQIKPNRTAAPAKKGAAKESTAKAFPFQNSLDFSPSKPGKAKKARPVHKGKAVPSDKKPTAASSKARVVTRSKLDTPTTAKTAKKPQTVNKPSRVTPRTSKAAIVGRP